MMDISKLYSSQFDKEDFREHSIKAKRSLFWSMFRWAAEQDFHWNFLDSLAWSLPFSLAWDLIIRHNLGANVVYSPGLAPTFNHWTNFKENENHLNE